MIIPATCFFELAGDKICRSIRPHRRPTVVTLVVGYVGTALVYRSREGLAPA